MYIPEFVIGFLAGMVFATVIIIASAVKFGRKEKDGGD